MVDRPTFGVRVELVFGETRLQVQPEADVSLEALVAEIEENLGLHPESFSIFDDFGKVGTSVALRRSLSTSVDGICVLKVHEDAAWRKIREMDAKIQMLVARCPVADNIMMDIEARSASRFAKLRSVLQDLDAKVNRSLAPLLQSMALQQMDENSKLDSVNFSSQAQEVSANMISNIAPLLQSMALQQMDIKKQIESLKLDSLTSSVKEARQELAELRTFQMEEVQKMEESTKELHKEVSAKDKNVQEVQDTVQALQRELHKLTARPNRDSDLRAPFSSAMLQDLGKCSKSSISFGGGGRDGEGHFSWPEGTTADCFSALTYSRKSQVGMTGSSNIEGALDVPFARFHAPRRHERPHGSRSLPLLPPVK